MPTVSALHRPVVLSLLACASLAGCLVGPNYRRPATPISLTYKEAAGWAPIHPSDAADRKDWWTVFNDPTLNELERRVAASNQTLAAAEAAYRQARALVSEQRAALFPTITLNGSATVASGNSGGTTVISGTNGGTTSGGTTAVTTTGNRTTYQIGAGASWAPDLWGAVRRAIENAKATAQSDEALVANARLSAQMELAVDYIQLRQLDQEKRLYDTTVASYARSLAVTQNKYKVGVAARSDVLTAESQLASAQATDEDLAQQRAKSEHAIAILAGQTPASLTLPSAAWTLQPPDIPAGVPSALLQRRPDVASSERLAAAANAAIGIQVAAYYPNLTLSAEGGAASSALSKLFNASNTFWSLGASVAETVFDAGLRKARVAAARAAYDQAVANYRQTTLTAFGQVEDNMAAQRVLIAEQVYTRRSSGAATQNVTITLNEYRAGTVDYTTVATAQATALNAQNGELALEAMRLSTAVDLIAALGGGWTAADLR